ncbi:MAG: BMC domain-containing protein [Sedimentibacter sp.]
MKNSTLGLIETYGFIGAIEALDVALKAANVELVSCEFVKGGIVTIIITGEVACVKAAVEASAVAVDKLGVLRNTHVIAKAYDEVWDILKVVKKSNDGDIKNSEDPNDLEKSEGSRELEESKESEEPEETEEFEEFEETKESEDSSIHINDEQDENIELLDFAEDSEKENKEEQHNFPNMRYTTKEELEGYKVTELRYMARQLEGISLTKKQIKFGKREELIEAIIADNKRRYDK